MLCIISVSLCFHTDLQDRKRVSPARAKCVESGGKQHLQSGKPAGPGLFDWTQPTTQLRPCGGERILFFACALVYFILKEKAPTVQREYNLIFKFLPFPYMGLIISTVQVGVRKK